MAVPILRFSEFSDEWEQRSIGDVYSFKNGLNKEKEFFGRGTPILNYMDVNKNRHIFCVDILGKVMLTQKEISNFGIRKGDLFFTRTSETSEEIGLAGVLMEDVFGGVFSGFLLRARPKTYSIDAAFSGYRFVTSEIRKEIVRHSSITTRALTNGALLSKVLFRMPGVKEQKKIASLLGLLDWRIKLQRRKVELLRDYKAGIMNSFFKSCSEWGTKRLGRESYIKARIGWRNLKSEEYVSSGIPMIANKHIEDGIIDWTSCDHITQERYDESPEIALRNGDVIFSKDGTLGNSAFIRELPEPATINGTMMMVRLSVEKDGVHPEYFYHITKSKYFENMISSIKSGGTVPHIFQRDIVDFEFPIPPTDIQERIASTLSKVDEICTCNNAVVKLLERYKNSLLSQLFV